MNKIVVDRSLRGKLNNLESRLELCDQSGETLGCFVPASEHERLLYAWARAEFSDEEIECARGEAGGWISLKSWRTWPIDEVHRDLEAICFAQSNWGKTGRVG